VRDPDDLWKACDFTDCQDPMAFYVEWDESERVHMGQFAGLYCNAHTAAIRAGLSPFEEWGSVPTVRLVRTVATHRAMCEAARAAVEHIW
jgi:hypothetical protein